MYLNKYLSGSIYLNYYFDGISGILAYSIGKPLYSNCKIRNSYLLSNAIFLFGSIGLYLFEGGIISPYFIDSFGFKSPYAHGSKKDKKWHLARIVPVFTFIAKFGVHITYANSYQASFSDPRTFPLLKRATATGICNFVARICTIFAPLAAELDSPYPYMVLIFLSTISLCSAFFFESRNEAA